MRFTKYSKKQIIFCTLLFALFICVVFFEYSKQPLAQEVVENYEALLPSVYGEVKVVDIDGLREMFINGGGMSAMNMSNRTQFPDRWDYLVCMEGPFQEGLVPSSPHTLNIGLGAGFIPTRLASVYNATVEAAELNPVVIDAAREYFAYDLPATAQDGRLYLQQSNTTYDAIFVDAAHFNNYTMTVPKQLLTQEFYTLAKQKLSSKGFFIQNFLISNNVRPTEYEVYATLSSVFFHVELYNCQNNRVFIAANNGFVLPELEKYHREIEPAENILTDDFFPQY